MSCLLNQRYYSVSLLDVSSVFRGVQRRGVCYSLSMQTWIPQEVSSKYRDLQTVSDRTSLVSLIVSTITTHSLVGSTGA